MTPAVRPRDERPAVEVEGLVKRYDGRAVVDGVSLRIERGETFALLGPNGAGKTTCVEILEGYRRADGGTVRVLGADPARAGRAHRARVGLMLQGGGGVDPRLEAREAIELYARLHARPWDPVELLEVVGLEAVARTRFRRLSGGERQRLAVAIALVGRPELIILDEPTAGLDVEGRQALVRLLGRLPEEGLTILLTSHDLLEVERLADRIAILQNGAIVASGSSEELIAASGPAVRFRLSAPLPDSGMAAILVHLRKLVPVAAVVAEAGPGRYRIDGVGAPDVPAVVAALASWCAAAATPIVELRTGGGSLEDRYFELVGGSRHVRDEAAS